MNGNLYGLKCEYCRQPERSLLISGETPLSSGHLVPAEEKMLQNYVVPGLLPIRFEETDLIVKMRFMMNNKRTLFAAVSTPGFDMLKFYQTLYRIMTTVEEGKAYLLNEYRYVLDPDYIYMEMSLSEPSLIYLPLKELQVNVPPKAGIGKLAQWMFTVMQGPKVKDSFVWEALNSEEIDWGETRKRIQLAIDKQLLSPFFPDREQTELKSVEDTNSSPHLGESRNEPSDSKGTFKKRDFKFRSLLFLPVIWSVFAWHPSEGSFFIIAGFTLLLAGALFLWIRSSGHALTQTIAAVSPDPAFFPMEASEYYSKLSMQTTLLSQPGETVLLSRSTAVLQSEDPRFALEIRQGEETAHLPLHGDHFVIGRDEEAVSHRDVEPGVSRVHLELSRCQDGYCAKDLDSKNGTLLNGERMVPLQEYPLQDGDRLSLANSEYFFKKICL